MNLPLRERAKMFLIENKYSVFPTGKNKIPLVPWIEYQNRFPTIEEIDAWWDKFPEAQIGIVTGEISNLTVVDVEKGGDASFLPQNTTMVKTGGGGIHLYYVYAEGIKNSTRIKELIDIRSEGGYVVAPYSSSDKGSYEYIKQVDELLPFPRELFPEKQTYQNQPAPAASITYTDVNKKMVDSYTGFGAGQRNDQMTKFIGKVVSRINPAHWETVGWSIVTAANAKNTPPLSARELQVTWNSIKGRKTHDIPIEGQIPGPTEPSWPSGDGSDEVKLMSTVAAEQQINTDDIYPLEMPCFDEAILGGVCPGDLVVISAQTGQGKTSLAQDWTISFLRGERKTPVLWFSYEVLVSQLWKKFKTMGAEDNELIVIPAKNTSGNVIWLEEKIKEAKEKFNCKVVVIDHLGFLLPKTTGVMGKNMSLNYSAYLTQVMRDIKTIALQEEIIVVLPVHMKKTDNIDMEAIGNSAGIGQESDLVFLMERERNRGKEAKSYFTDFTKITLAKNRKTGKTVSAWFTMIKERFAYDIRNKEDADKEDWGSFGKVDPKNDTIKVGDKTSEIVFIDPDEDKEDDNF